MSATCTWSITELKTYSDDANQDIVQVANWAVTAEDGQATAKITGSTPLGTPSSGFIAYQDLTEDLVLLWVKYALGEAQINAVESGVIAEVEAQTYQPKPLPWTQPKQLTDKATAVPS